MGAPEKADTGWEPSYRVGDLAFQDPCAIATDFLIPHERAIVERGFLPLEDGLQEKLEYNDSVQVPDSPHRHGGRQGPRRECLAANARMSRRHRLKASTPTAWLPGCLPPLLQSKREDRYASPVFSASVTLHSGPPLPAQNRLLGESTETYVNGPMLRKTPHSIAPHSHASPSGNSGHQGAVATGGGGTLVEGIEPSY